MSAVEFPRAMSPRKADRWLAANNPHRGEGYAEWLWAMRFWKDQTAKHLKSASRALLVARVALAISVTLLIVVVIARLVLA